MHLVCEGESFYDVTFALYKGSERKLLINVDTKCKTSDKIPNRFKIFCKGLKYFLKITNIKEDDGGRWQCYKFRASRSGLRIIVISK